MRERNLCNRNKTQQRGKRTDRKPGRCCNCSSLSELQALKHPFESPSSSYLASAHTLTTGLPTNTTERAAAEVLAAPRSGPFLPGCSIFPLPSSRFSFIQRENYRNNNKNRTSSLHPGARGEAAAASVSVSLQAKGNGPCLFAVAQTPALPPSPLLQAGVLASQPASQLPRRAMPTGCSFIQPWFMSQRQEQRWVSNTKLPHLVSSGAGCTILTASQPTNYDNDVRCRRLSVVSSSSSLSPPTHAHGQWRQYPSGLRQYTRPVDRASEARL